MLTVDKQGGILAVGGGEIGSGDIIDGLRFDRLERGAWKVSDATGVCSNWIVMSEHTAQYDFKRDPDKGLRVLRHTELDVFKPERGITWTPWRKPINVRVSPEYVMEGTAVRLITDDKVDIPMESNGLVKIQVKGGTFAAVISSGGRGKVLRELYVRRGADTRPVKRAVDAAMRDQAPPAVAPLNNTLSQLSLKV